MTSAIPASTVADVRAAATGWWSAGDEVVPPVHRSRPPTPGRGGGRVVPAAAGHRVRVGVSRTSGPRETCLL